MKISDPGGQPTVGWWDLVEEAKILLGSSSGRQEARRRLEKVVSEAQGTPAALEAMRLLQQTDSGEQRVFERKNPEIEELRQEWLHIVSPLDSRLPGFLDKLRQRPVALAELLPEVSSVLRRWIGHAADEIQASLNAKREPDESRLEAMERLAAVLVEIPSFETELRNDLLRFRQSRFQILLVESENEIRSACQAWDIDRAWQLLERLDSAGSIYDKEVRRLEQEVYDADAFRTEVELDLHRWKAETPSQWAGLRVLLESLTVVRRHLEDSRVPPKWIAELQLQAEQLVAEGRAFLQGQAARATSTEELREFWRNYLRLDPAAISNALEERPEWFETVLARIGEETAATAACSHGPEDLEVLAQRLGAEVDNLPSGVSARLGEWSGQLRRIGESWRQMESGEEFTPPNDLIAGAVGLIPERFLAEAPLAQERLSQVRLALSSLELAGTVADQEAACKEALKISRRVLRQVPEHRSALRLRRRAEQLQVHLRLDEALGRWDAEAFLLSGRLEEAGAAYRDLSQAAAALRQLASLVSLPEFLESRDAAYWWQQWKRGVASLPQLLPRIFAQAVQIEESRRSGEWSLAVDRLLRTDPTPEACQEAAESMADFLDLPGLAAYFEELLQKEKIGRIERLIEDGHWSHAEEELRSLDRHPAEYRRLACRLAVLRARAAGPVELAEEVARNWADLLAAFGDQAYDLLEEALSHAWKKRETAALRKLGEIVRRAARSTDLPPHVTEHIQDWLQWLQVEKALEEGISASSLRQLGLYAEKHKSSLGLGVRLRSWVERWKQRDETVALAWVFHAFPHLFAPGEADPTEELAAHSREVAGHVLLALRARADLEIAGLLGLRQQLGDCERDWRDLHDYLDLLPHRVERPPIPEELRQARDLLGNLLRATEGVERLESSDLRQPPAVLTWRSIRLTLVKDLEQLPSSAWLRSRLERLEPLMKLSHFEIRLRETAGRCNDPDPQELDHPGLFAEAAGWTQAIIESFETAGLVGRDMWSILSTEYWREIPPLAGDLEAPPAQQDLEALARRLDALENEESDLRQTLRQLDAQEPWVSADGPFFPESHRHYLDLYPRTRPSSRRAFRLFDRFAKVGARPVILRDGAGDLPAWISDYLNRGVP